MFGSKRPIKGESRQPTSLADELTLKHALNSYENRLFGGIFGAALGDALAAPVEFLSRGEILGRYPPFGPMEVVSGHHRVTDDTRMMVAVMRALCAVGGDFQPLHRLANALVSEFVRWANEPQHDRAPGQTCLDATRRLAQGNPWLDATVLDSKGAGAVMRVAPIGSFFAWEFLSGHRSPAAQLQAAITHGHPTALAAADATSLVIRLVAANCPAGEILDRLQAYGATPPAYPAFILGDLWRRAGAATRLDYVRVGWHEVSGALMRVRAALANNHDARDPCELCGDGWVAEDALATALYCFLADPRHPAEVLRRACVTRGDSDTIACIAGAFVGTYCGFYALPKQWLAALEGGEELFSVALGMRAALATQMKWKQNLDIFRRVL